MNLSIILTVTQDGNFVNNVEHMADVDYCLRLFDDTKCITTTQVYDELVSQLNKKLNKSKSTKKAIKRPPPFEKHFIQIGKDVNTLREAIQSVSDNEHLFVIGKELLVIEALTWANDLHIMINPNVESSNTTFPIGYIIDKFQPIEGQTTNSAKVIKYRRVR